MADALDNWTGLVSDKPALDSKTLREMGTEYLDPSAGQAWGASIGRAFGGLQLPRVVQQSALSAAELGLGGVKSELPFTPPEWQQPVQSEPVMSPDEARSEFGIPGVLDFKTPISRARAQFLHDQKRAAAERDDILRRNEGSLIGGAARLATDFAIGALDPLNIAAAFVPVPGVGALGTRLLTAAGEGALARAGARAVVGGITGAAGAAALQPLEYGLSRAEWNDYTMHQALANIAFGTVLGGGLHTAGGYIGDRLRNPFAQRLEEAGPEVRADMLKAGVAQVAEGRDVNVAPLFDHAEAVRAEADLARFSRQQERMDQHADAAIDALRPGEKAAAVATQARSRLDDLARQAEGLHAEIAAAPTRGLSEEAQARLAAARRDETTIARLGAIERELAGTVPVARRTALEAERRLLTEGVAPPTSEDILGAARGEAEATGLRRQLARVTVQQQRAEAALARAQGRTAPIEADYNVTAGRIESQQNLLQALAERAIRRFAWGAGKEEFTPQQVRAMAARILGDKAEIPKVLREIAGEPVAMPGTPLPPREPLPDITGALRQSTLRTADEVMQAARAEPTLRDPVAEAEAQQVKERVPATTDEAAAQKLLDDTEAELAASRQPPPEGAAAAEGRPEIPEVPEGYVIPGEEPGTFHDVVPGGTPGTFRTEITIDGKRTVIEGRTPGDVAAKASEEMFKADEGFAKALAEAGACLAETALDFAP